MSNTSATGGYLSPTTVQGAEGTVLQRFLQQIVVNITGLDGAVVRPGGHAHRPQRPAASATWCAIGILRRQADTNPALVYSPGQSATIGELVIGVSPLEVDGLVQCLIRHETLEIAASFYGPDGAEFAAFLRDGLFIGQNREVMAAQQFGLLDIGDLVSAPDLTNEQWLPRFDLTFRLRRKIERTYAILPIVSAPVSVASDQ